MPDRVVDIPGVGAVAFPESMGDDAINQAAAKLYSESSRPQMNTAVVNGERVPVDDGPMDAAKGFGQNINPIPMLVELGNSLIHGGKGAAAAMRGDVQTWGDESQKAASPFAGLLKAQGALFEKGKAAAAQGDYVTAARHLVDWLIPVLGPALDDSANDMQAGKPWSGMGKALGIGAGIAAPKAIEAVGARRVNVPAVAKNANPVEAEALALAEREGIPVDAGVATGNPFVKRALEMADSSPVGSMVAQRANAARTQALRDTGERLAGRVYPEAVTPETAGQSVRDSVQQTRDAFGSEANRAYDELRGVAAQTVRDVPAEAPRLSPRAVRGMVREFGKELTPEELSEVRRIKAELETQRYSDGKLVQERLDDSGTYYIPREANAAVYHDIRQLAPGTADMTGAEMSLAIDKALEEGRWTNPARGAVDVARARLAGKSYVRGTRLSKPTLPPGAGDVPPDLVSMQMPVDLRTPKKMLKPLYDRLTRTLPPALRNADEGYTALKSIMDYPDFAPLADVDPALGALKGMSRTSESAELRNLSQGLAAQAVKELDKAVRQAAEQGGPKALDALDTGRAATRAKYGADDVLRSIRQEPVQAFRQAVYSKDSGIAQLRKVQELAPQEMPKLGRAFVEDLLSTATEKGGFGKGGTLNSKWQSLGPETRKILFGETGPDLDRFFLLAEKLGERQNTSATALSMHATAQTMLVFTSPATGVPVALGTGALSKILRSPKAVKLLTKGMQLSLGPARTSAAARASAASAVLSAAREAGVSLPAARAASGPSTRPPQQTAR